MLLATNCTILFLFVIVVVAIISPWVQHPFLTARCSHYTSMICHYTIFSAILYISRAYEVCPTQ